MNLTGYMQGKTSLLNFSWILFKIAVSSAELNQAEKHSSLPKDLPHSSFKCQRACMVFFSFAFIYSRKKISKDLCYFQFKDHHRLQKKMLLLSFYMGGQSIFSWIRASTKGKAICLHNTPTEIPSVRVTAWGFSSCGCHVEEILCYLRDYLRKVWEAGLVTVTGCFI